MNKKNISIAALAICAVIFVHCKSAGPAKPTIPDDPKSALAAVTDLMGASGDQLYEAKSGAEAAKILDHLADFQSAALAKFPELANAAQNPNLKAEDNRFRSAMTPLLMSVTKIGYKYPDSPELKAAKERQKSAQNRLVGLPN